MKHIYLTQKNKGIGLIEVMVTTVVIALGLLAVASLQGELASSNKSNKTLAECQVLANSKIEELRDWIERTAPTTPPASAKYYESLADSTAAESIAGLTETFSRSWLVTNFTDPDGVNIGRNIKVTVEWGDDIPENKCKSQGIISYDNLGNSALAATGEDEGFGSSPSTNANSSDEINDSTDVDISNATSSDTPGLLTVDGLEDGQYVKDNGNSDDKGSIVYVCDDLIPFEHGLYTRRVHYRPENTTFKEAIELFEDNNDNLTCTRRIRFNGGVILSIDGIIFSRATTGNGVNVSLLELRESSNTQLFTFNATESGSFCVFNPVEGATSAPYICYVGGNCIDGPVGTIATTDGLTFSEASTNSNTIVTQCPAPITDTATSPIYLPTVYDYIGPGGWRGKVGLLGIPDSGKNVCFQEELTPIAQAQASLHTLDTARNYFALRTISNINFNEGINQSYSCHDMIIIDGQSTIVQVHSKCIDEAAHITGIENLALKNITRILTDSESSNETNIVQLVSNTDSCSSDSSSTYTIVGSYSNASSTPSFSFIATDGVTGTCTTNTSESTYSCGEFTTSSVSVTITGDDGNGSESCFLAPISNSGCDIAFVTPQTGVNTVYVTVAPTGTGTLSDILITGTNSTCIDDQCEIENTLSDTLIATANCNGTPTTVTASTSITAGATSATITMPLCTAPESETTYTFSGAIKISTLTSVTSINMTIDNGTCSGRGNLTDRSTALYYNYECTVAESAPFVITYTVAPECTSSPAKKHALSISGGTNSAVGQVTITKSTGISSNQVAGGTITRGANCN